MTERQEDNGAIAVYNAIDEAAKGLRSQHVLNGIALSLAGYVHQSSVPVETLMADMRHAVETYLAGMSHSSSLNEPGNGRSE